MGKAASRPRRRGRAPKPGCCTPGVTVAGIHQNEIPFFVMALLLAFGGSFEWLHVAGAILVLAGAALAQLRQLRPLPPGESQNQASGS